MHHFSVLPPWRRCHQVLILFCSKYLLRNLSHLIYNENCVCWALGTSWAVVRGLPDMILNSDLVLWGPGEEMLFLWYLDAKYSDISNIALCAVRFLSVGPQQKQKQKQKKQTQTKPTKSRRARETCPLCSDLYLTSVQWSCRDLHLSKFESSTTRPSVTSWIYSPSLKSHRFKSGFWNTFFLQVC